MKNENLWPFSNVRGCETLLIMLKISIVMGLYALSNNHIFFDFTSISPWKTFFYFLYFLVCNIQDKKADRWMYSQLIFGNLKKTCTRIPWFNSNILQNGNIWLNLLMGNTVKRDRRGSFIPSTGLCVIMTFLLTQFDVLGQDAILVYRISRIS